jgi:3-hydroxyisobutyrate dehydrogenase
MVLGMKAGMDPALIYETLSDSAGTSRMFEVRGPLMRDSSYDRPTATIRTHLKDISIIGAFAADLECPVPLFSSASQLYFAGAAQGREGQDTASVCAVLEDMAGISRTEAPSPTRKR